MSDTPDFEVLRQARNAERLAFQTRMSEELNLPMQRLEPSLERKVCYCACSSGGPCEHSFDGEKVEIAHVGGWGSSIKCSRCGLLELHHTRRLAP